MSFEWNSQSVQQQTHDKLFTNVLLQVLGIDPTNGLHMGNGVVPMSAPPGPGEDDWAAAARGRGLGQKPPNLENALSELLTDSQARHQGSAVSLEAIQVSQLSSVPCGCVAALGTVVHLPGKAVHAAATGASS